MATEDVHRIPLRARRPLCKCGSIPGGVDVHTHVVPSQFPGRTGPLPTHWPTTVPGEDPCHRTVVIDGRPYRTVSDACWVAERRLLDMDEAGIAVQALSPMPELFGYWMERSAAVDLVRYTNDVIAAIVDVRRSRFVGLGGVPLQDIDAAITELHRVVETLGFAGVEIGSNVNGTAIGDPRLRPFFAEAERLGAAVFVHAVRPTGMNRLVGPAPLQQVLAYPTDVGLAAASAITGNLLLDHPDLRIAFSHGGGTLAALLPRLEQGHAVFPALRDAMPLKPSEMVRRLYVDSLVFAPATLQHLVAMVGEDRVMIGTDYPFNFCDKQPVGGIETAFPDPVLRRKLTFANATAFLALPEND